MFLSKQQQAAQNSELEKDTATATELLWLCERDCSVFHHEDEAFPRDDDNTYVLVMEERCLFVEENTK